MQSGHGKMDDRGDKFIISSASSSSRNSTKNLVPPRNIVATTECSSWKVSQQQPQKSTLFSSSRQYFKNPIFPFCSATMWNQQSQEEYKYPKRDHENEEDILSGDEATCTSNNHDFCSRTSSSCSSSSNFCSHFGNNTTADTTTTWTSTCNDPNHLLGHHRSRIKADTISSSFFPNFCDDDKENQYPSSSSHKLHRRSRLQNKEGRQPISSSNSTSPTSSTTPTSPSATSTSSSTSPSRFLLTFLSTCHLVQVTSRLVVALAITSLFLILLHVMPGAYCASSSTTLSSSSSSGAAIIITQRAYMNKSVRSLQFSSKPELSRGGRDGPLLKMTAKTNNEGFMTEDEEGNINDEDDFPEVENVHSKNQLVITKRSTYSNYNNKNDFSNYNISSNRVQREEGVVDYKSAKTDSKLLGGNYDYYNNGNNNNNNDKVSINNRSNYNYYDSFIVESTSGRQNISKIGYQDKISDKSSSTRNNNHNSENNKAASDNNNTQPKVGIIAEDGQPRNRDRAAQRSSILYNDDFTDNDLSNLDQGKASTGKDGITIGDGGAGVSGYVARTNNGTTKAERDSISNVSSTGIRPTMAFTKSYYGRNQFNKEIERNGEQEEEIYNGGGEEDMDLYGGTRETNQLEDGNGEEDDGELMQSDQSPFPHHPSSQLDNNTEKLSHKGSTRAVEKNEWNGEDKPSQSRKQLDELQKHGFPVVPSTSHHHHHSFESSSSSSTQFISTTKTTITADSKGEGKGTTTLQRLSPVASGTTTGNGEKGSTSSMHFAPETTSSKSKLKSIKFSSFPQNKNKNSEGPSHHFSINKINLFSSFSTASFHYPNESSNNVPLVVSSSKAPSSPSSSSSSTLSNQNNLVHHHQRFQTSLHHHYEELAFGRNTEYVDDAIVDEDQVTVDDDAGEEDEFLDDNNEQEINPEDGNRTGRKNRVTNLTIGKQKVSSISQNSENFVELFPRVKTRGELRQVQAQPTKSAVSRKTTYPESFPPLDSNSERKHTGKKDYYRLTQKKKNEEDQIMLGDDPSNLIGRDNVFSKRSSSSNSASTTAQTFSGVGGGSVGKQRSPLQIRRDLSRLIASAAGRNGQNGGNVIGADEEPIPNKCDRLFMSSGAANGTSGIFESPTMISEEGHLYQCIFMFVAKPMERVELVFQQFNVRGTPPECVHEWVDIWTEVEGTDPTDLVTTPFSGRYCGKIPPRRRISLYGGIAIGFYSDKNSTDETIFRGTFAFINDSPYQIGTPVPRTLCSYTILGASKRNGDLISPTYPGVYPKNLSCSYKFIGIEGQRIRLEFRDFDVFYGGAHCPFDEVKVYDGMDPTSALIGTYCGQQRNLVVFSSAHLMLVTFTTLERSTEAQNRGFKGVWEFSESFVKLDFIEKNMGTHIRGTECDQRILSKGQSAGVVYSPNYPFPYVPKIVCRYFIYGLQDPQHLERVRLSFEKFDVITNINSAEEETTNQSEAKKCGDGFLKVYLKGQEVIQAYDKADFEFCGKEVPHDVVSDGPRLVLVFSSGEAVGSGFKARYQFETEYRVPGTAAPDGSCHFTYYSSSRMKGEFNSPRFPSNYPSTTNCTYIFFQQPNEQVRIVFDNFKMRSDKFNYTDRGAYGDLCEEDWVEVWNVISDAEDRLVGRYCGSTAPGPIESREKASALKVILHTDEEGVSSGFKARYIYFTAKTIFGECGQNITQAQSGVLTSPKWPGKYDGPSKGEGSATCNWYLSVRPGSRVMLHFQNFAIEGEPNGRGCPAAAVRIWVDPDGVPVELCGESLMVENSQYVSARNLMRVTFITADKAVGAPGFRAVWTEVQEVTRQSSGAPCHHSYFRCEKSLFCIPAELRCDGVDNCGTMEGEGDSSDEDRCGLEFGDMNFLIAVIIGVAISLFFIVLLCAWGQRRKRRRRRRLQLRRPPIHVCDNAGARFAAMDSV